MSIKQNDNDSMFNLAIYHKEIKNYDKMTTRINKLNAFYILIKC